MKHSAGMQKTTVLLVEDHEAFRRLVRSVLREQKDWELVGEAEDGLAGVRRCVELQPDLVLLDIGLPGLNGIQVARRIREFVPACKIVFLTQERSQEMVEEALGLGAAAYVLKAHTASDLALAMIAARDGRYFVTAEVDPRRHSDGRSPLDVSSDGQQTLQSAPGDLAHEMHIYPDHPSLESGLASFIERSLKAGKSVLCLIAPRHRGGLMQCLQAQGVDSHAAIADGRLVPVDVAELLPQFMVDGRLDRELLLAAATKLVETLESLKSAGGICSCGEVAPTLWALGHGEAAVEVERVWHELGKRHAMGTYCTYVLDGARCARDPHCYQQLCDVHSHVASH